MANNPRIVEGYGYFYSNYDSRDPNLPNLIENSELAENYGIVIGPQQADQLGNKHNNTVGIYIEDYERYVSDLAARATGMIIDPIITDKGMFLKNMEVMQCVVVFREDLCSGYEPDNVKEMQDIKNKYGLSHGPAIDVGSDCKYAQWGLYIVNYEQYLKDREEGYTSIKKKILGKN